MRQETINIYQFSELTEEAKERAVSEFSDINTDYNWWEFVYTDAESIGLKITGFNLMSFCKGELFKDIAQIIDLIFEHRGENCDTYKIAALYKIKLAEITDEKVKAELIKDGYSHDDDDIADEKQSQIDELEEEFKKELLEEYLSILRREYEYRTSEEAIIESIESNGYEFTSDGEHYA